MSWQSWPNLDNDRWFEESPCGGRNTNECGRQWLKVKMLLLHWCAFRKFYVQIFNTRLMRLWVIEGPNKHDQIVFCGFHSFLVEVQINDCYLHATQCNNNLEIRIAGSSCRIVFNFFWDLQSLPREIDNNAHAKCWRDNKEYYGLFWSFK